MIPVIEGGTAGLYCQGNYWERVTMKNPYEHKLNGAGEACAESCPACLWAEHFEATGDSQRSSITDRPDLTAEELNARFERLFGPKKE
jgi:hypothetical protein